eukprot:4386442-Prymnesium_polylepis.1
MSVLYTAREASRCLNAWAALVFGWALAHRTLIRFYADHVARVARLLGQDARRCAVCHAPWHWQFNCVSCRRETQVQFESYKCSKRTARSELQHGSSAPSELGGALRDDRAKRGERSKERANLLSSSEYACVALGDARARVALCKLP